GVHAKLTRCQRHALRVIARRKRDHAAVALEFRQSPETVEGTAELEGSAALQVLAFEEHLGADKRVDRPRRDDGRVVGNSPQSFGRGTNVVEADREVYGLGGHVRFCAGEKSS